MSECEIVKNIYRQKTLIYNFLINPKDYDKKKHMDKPVSLNLPETWSFASTLLKITESTQIETEINISCTS